MIKCIGLLTAVCGFGKLLSLIVRLSAVFRELKLLEAEHL